MQFLDLHLSGTRFFRGNLFAFLETEDVTVPFLRQISHLCVNFFLWLLKKHLSFFSHESKNLLETPALCFLFTTKGTKNGRPRFVLLTRNSHLKKRHPCGPTSAYPSLPYVRVWPTSPLVTFIEIKREGGRE